MITKIISGGQTGADQAALDAAIEFGIPHGGWIPKGRKTERGRLPDRYHLKEISSIDYQKRTELNVIDSDGTLILSHGKLTGGSALTQKLAAKHRKPCLHMDLNAIDQSKVIEIITAWIDARDIKILNVAGPRASKDGAIYGDTKKLLASVIQHYQPKTVDEAVDRLLSELPLREKTRIAKVEEHEILGLHQTIGPYVRNRFGLWAEDSELVKSSRSESGKKLHPDEVAGMILRELWQRLRKTHSVRKIK